MFNFTCNIRIAKDAVVTHISYEPRLLGSTVKATMQDGSTAQWLLADAPSRVRAFIKGVV